jgi:tRNA modification GTPase
MNYDDTIVAAATSVGFAAIGVVRLSGTQALPLLEAIMIPHRAGQWRSRHVRYGHIVAPDGARIDEVLAYWMRRPTTYTGEDVVEISCHGGRVAVELVIARCIEAGARLAHPGEFTMRAYAAGRIDLSQAEAVMDVIQAQTPQALRQAHHQLNGWVGIAVAELRAALLYELAAVIARIDFPDDVSEDALNPTALRAVVARLQTYIEGARTGILLRDGAQVALLGRPNVGKSSLLNTLLRTNRALVSPVAGTTRDTLEESADIHGIPVRFVDTAGIRAQTSDEVERMGIARSHDVAASADLALVLIDSSSPMGAEDDAVRSARGAAPSILVCTKTDLPIDLQTVAQIEQFRQSNQFVAVVAISTKTGSGVDELRQCIAQTLQSGGPATDSRITNTRHRDALIRAKQSVADAIAGIDAHLSAELLAIDLQEAVAALGEITGEDATEALLDVVFARFCIGK